MRNLCLVLAAALAACGGDDGAASPDAAPTIDAAPHVGACNDPGALPVYMNRDGGDYVMGAEDPSTNTSSILQAAATLPPYTADTWDALVDCVAAMIGSYDLRVTEEDPGDVDQIEMVVSGGGSAAVIGQAGVSEVSPFTCMAEPDSIHFAFPSEVGAPPDPQALCDYVVQGIGHAAGLEFVVDCGDVMAWNVNATTCTDGGGFTDAVLACGDTTAHACQCGGGTTQSSDAKMLAAFGACP